MSKKIEITVYDKTVEIPCYDLKAKDIGNFVEQTDFDNSKTEINNIIDSKANSIDFSISEVDEATEVPFVLNDDYRNTKKVFDTAIGNMTPSIINEASGKLITISDNSIGKVFNNLTVYGDSIQNSTPAYNSTVEVTGICNNEVLTIKSCGKNLVNYTKFESKTIGGISFTNNNDGSVTINGKSENESAYYLFYNTYEYKFEPGTYVISEKVLSGSVTNDSNYNRVRVYSNETDYINYSVNSPFTITGNEYKVHFLYVVRPDATYTNLRTCMQIEKGSVPTSYEVYQEKVLEIPITNGPLYAVDSFKDCLTKVDGKYGIMRNCGKIVFDGILDMPYENMYLNTAWDEQYPGYKHSAIKIDNMTTDQSKAEKSNWLVGQVGFKSNRFICTTEKNRNFTNNELMTHTSNGALYLFIADDIIGYTSGDTSDTILTKIKTWMSNNPFYVIYAINNPYFEPFEDEVQNKINEFTLDNMITNIFNLEGGSMDITYIADTKRYINSKISELETAIAALS